MSNTAFPIDGTDDLVQATLFWARDLDHDAFVDLFARLFKKRTLTVPQNRPLRAYIGAALFTQFEREQNERLKSLLDAMSVDAYLPQVHGGRVSEMVSHGTTLEEALKTVYRKDVWALRHCDIYIAGRWGNRGDEGECWEHGCAWAWEKACLAVHEHRELPIPGIGNPMIIRSLAHEPFPDIASLCAWLKEEIEKRRVT